MACFAAVAFFLSKKFLHELRSTPQKLAPHPGALVPKLARLSGVCQSDIYNYVKEKLCRNLGPRP